MKYILIFFLFLNLFLHLFKSFTIEIYYNHFILVNFLLVLSETMVLWKIDNYKKINGVKNDYYFIMIPILLFLTFFVFDYLSTNYYLDFHQNNIKYEVNNFYNIHLEENNSTKIDNSYWISEYYFQELWWLSIWMSIIGYILIILFPLFWPFSILLILDEKLWDNIKLFFILLIIFFILNQLSSHYLILFFFISFFIPILFIKLLDYFFDDFWSLFKVIFLVILNYFFINWTALYNTTSFVLDWKFWFQSIDIMYSDYHIKWVKKLDYNFPLKNINRDWYYYIYLKECKGGTNCYFYLWSYKTKDKN